MSENLADTYQRILQDILASVVHDEKPSIDQAASLITKALLAGGITHIFGAGHSQLVAGDTTFRAGGPAWANAIFDPVLSITRGAFATTKSERVAANADAIFGQERLQPTDATVVVCNSGTTQVSVRWAQLCKERGLAVISIVSQESMKFLNRGTLTSISEYSDIIIDNHCPIGDAAITQSEGSRQVSVGPTSSIINMFLVHWIFIATHDQLLQQGREVEAFQSGHLPGAWQFNERLLSKYRERVRVF